jgi:histidinol dehydrogenase
MPQGSSGGDGLSGAVAAIIEEVRRRGDEALVEFARRWDGASLSPDRLRVPEEAIAAADDSTPFAAAFRRAAERIRRFHQEVKPRSIAVDDPEGVRMEVRWTALRSAGLYVPGGKASYPSTLAMTAVPAQVAGVERIAVVSPPGPDGEVSAPVLLAAKVLGIREVYRTGGAQAIAALALGTATIRPVDKVFGPGNAYVAEAKRQLYGAVGIDLLAGPSEIVVYADGSADPEWAAADLIAQAEHDEATRPTLLASSPAVLAAVRAAIDRRLRTEPRGGTARAALDRNGIFEVAAGLEAAAARIDEIAPEHLSIQSVHPRALLAMVRNAGAVYLGGSSPVALGDYYAGPNHVLPTGRAARFASVLSVEDFMKRSSVVEASPEFLRARGADVETLAEGERLPAHASSIRARGVTSAGARAGLREAAAYGAVEEEAEVKLNQNECPWDVPEALKDRILAGVRGEPWNRYPQRLPEELRRNIARDENVPEEGVWLGNGSNLILQWIFEAFGGPGRAALVPRPSFSLYRMWGRISETAVEEFALGEWFEYRPKAVVEAILRSRPALTVLCLPNNPTGNELSREEVVEIAGAAERAGGLVVIDEAYREFSAGEYDRTPLVRERPNVVLVRTYSKAFAAAGLRLGYLLAAPAVGRELGKIIPPFHLSHFAAVAGAVLWSERGRFQEQVERIVAERERLRALLAAIRGAEPLPSQANFFLLKVPDAAAVFDALRERGILLRKPGDDPSLRGFLRVTTGAPEENDRLVRALREVLEG